jgi:chromosome segregation ATPase
MSDEKPVYHFLKVAHPEAWDAERYLRDEIARLAERCDAYKGQVKAGDEQLARLTRERDKLQSRFDYIAEHLPNGWSHCTTEKELCEHAHFVESEIAALRRRAAQMERAVKKYASHSPYCAQNKWPTKGHPFAPCDCGLDAALSPSPPAEERESGT